MGLFDWLFGSSQTQKQDQTATSTSTPSFGAGGDLNTVVLNMIKSRLAGPGADLSGYTANGLAQINKNAALTKMGNDNALTARGLGSSPVAGVVDANANTARVGQATQFQNSIPLLQRELQNQDLGLAGSALGLNRGGTTTGTSSGTSTTTTSGLDIPKLLGYLIASGAFGGGSGSGS